MGTCPDSQKFFRNRGLMLRLLVLLGVAGLAVGADFPHLRAQCALPPVPAPAGAESLGTAIGSGAGFLAVGDSSSGASGKVQLYQRSGLSWSWAAEVTPADLVTSSSFGAAIAANQEALLVGAPTHGGPMGTQPNRGGVFVGDYQTSGDVVVAPTSQAGDLFGTSVAWGQGRWVAGAPGASNNAGSVSVFLHTPFGPEFEQTVVPNDPEVWARFGESVAMLGNDLLVVGAPGADGFQGAIYVFARVANVWVQSAKLTVSNSVAGDQLGRSVAVWQGPDSVRVLAGAPGVDSPIGIDVGRVISFELTGSTWQQETLPHPFAQPFSEAGTSLAVHGDLLVVGCPGQNDYEGAGLVFQAGSGLAPDWSLESLVESDTGIFSEGGAAVAIDDDGIAWLGARLAQGGGSVCGFVVSDRDCNANGEFDRCDVLQGLEVDLNNNGVPDPCETFVRGDLNGDGNVNFPDAVRLLSGLFGSNALDCLAAADVNVDDAINIADCVRLLNSLFVFGSVPVAQPWPNCGVDNDTSWPCEVPVVCP